MKRIVATYHHGFAGGSKNTSRLLHTLSQCGWDIDAFFFEKPQYFSLMDSVAGLRTHNYQGIHSEVIATECTQIYSASEQILKQVSELKNTVLFGANLFPYCNILHDVKSQLPHSHGRRPNLIIHPVGSDIWQIGPQIKNRVSWLLNSPLVDEIVTYSNTFIEEIVEYYGVAREIRLLPPVLDTQKFYPISEAEKAARRRALGLQEHDFIMHHHSSMRRVKCPEIVLDIAIKAAEMFSGPAILIMVGPAPSSLLALLRVVLEDLPEKTLLRSRTRIGKLTVYWTGVTSNVEYLLQLADVEINTSLHDSFNLALMEAMACGVAVVSSDIVGIAEHIRKASAGICFRTQRLGFDDLNVHLSAGKPTHRFFAIEEAINALVDFEDNREHCRAVGERGARYSMNVFSAAYATEEFSKCVKC